MRTYASHEHARRRMEDRFQQHQRIDLDDLLRYLEDVSSEPAGEEAYGLALSLRRMSLPEEHLLDLVLKVQDRLASCGNPSFAAAPVRNNLDQLAQFLAEKLRCRREGGAPPKTPGKIAAATTPLGEQPASASNTHEDTERSAAGNQGCEISHSLRSFYKWHLFHNMAALALYWTSFKPSSQPATEPIPWIEEDVIRMFP